MTGVFNANFRYNRVAFHVYFNVQYSNEDFVASVMYQLRNIQGASRRIANLEASQLKLSLPDGTIKALPDVDWHSNTEGRFLIDQSSPTYPILLSDIVVSLDADVYQRRGRFTQIVRNLLALAKSEVSQIVNDRFRKRNLIKVVRHAVNATFSNVVDWECMRIFANVNNDTSRLFASRLDDIKHCPLPHLYDMQSTATVQRLDDLPERIFAAIQGFPHNQFAAALAARINLNDPLIIPTYAEDSLVFVRIMEALGRFHHTDKSLSEAQFVSQLWTPLFQAAIVDRTNGLLFTSTEYNVCSIDNQLNKQFTDYVALYSHGDAAQRPPTFWSEASCHRLANNISGDEGFIHKDKRKLMVHMGCSLLHYLGLFSKKPDKQRQLKIYGAFIAGTQLQYCMIIPLLNSANEFLGMLFQTDAHWRIDMAGTSVCPCLTAVRFAAACQLCCSFNNMTTTLPSAEIRGYYNFVHQLFNRLIQAQRIIFSLKLMRSSFKRT
jgi:hypothetical protein